MDSKIKEIGKLVMNQDNRYTDQPMFLVEKEVVDYGFTSDWADEYHWQHVDDPECIADQEKSQELDELDSECEDIDEWEKVYFRKRWEFVTACFTEQGCKDFLEINGHNVGKSRIFAAGSFRNNEYQYIRGFLMNYAESA